MQGAHAQDLPEHRTRKRLVARLRELQRAASTRELAADLGLHVNGVRRHLVRLEAAGTVERRTARARRGRPRAEWLLAPEAQRAGGPPRRYEDLARWLGRTLQAGAKDDEDIEVQGREIGRELAPDDRRSGSSAPHRFRDALAALGFDPVLEPGPRGRVRCRLCNCPYLETARESPSVVCTLHRGITTGLLEAVEPTARLERWEAHDPDEAGCLAEIAASGWEPAMAGDEPR